MEKFPTTLLLAKVGLKLGTDQMAVFAFTGSVS
jgi:hypothetical protein